MRPPRRTLLNVISLATSPRFGVDARNRALVRAVRGAGPWSTRMVRVRRRLLGRRERLIAVTGTQGKTTTVRCIRAVLGLPPSKLTETSANMRRSLSLLLLREPPWRRYAAVEAGIAAPGQMRPIMRLLRPHVSVVTSIGTEHFANYPDRDALRSEKALAVRLLPASGTAILNGDDPLVASMAAETQARVLTFGMGPENTVRGSDVELRWPRGTRFTVHAGGEAHEVRTRLFGLAGLYAALAAIAVGHAEGIPLGAAAGRLARVRPTHRRNEVMKLEGGGYALVDDSKAPPEVVDAFMDLVGQVPAARRFFLLGELCPTPGPEAAFYERFAEGVAPLAERVIVAGTEAVQAKYASAFGVAGFDPARLRFAPNATAAAGLLRGQLGPGDVLFVKGTGNLRLTRAALALSGRDVRCRRETCDLAFIYCEDCKLLGRDA